MLHHPIYTPRADRLFGHKSELKMRQQLEQLLIGGHVDAVIQGHNHFYARLKPNRASAISSPDPGELEPTDSNPTG